MEVTSFGLQAFSQTGNSNTSESASVISSDFETFLNMLTAQLENQDPLDPVKSEDFAVQLATFSGVEQQVLTNDLLTGLSAQMGISGMGQFANWVGMEARAAVPAQFDGNAITLSPKPDLTADEAVLVVSDTAGNIIQLKQINVSHDTIEWDGTEGGATLSPGLYSFAVESYSNGTVSSVTPVEVYTQVTEARTLNGETVLVTQGGVEVPATQITALRQPT